MGHSTLEQPDLIGPRQLLMHIGLLYKPRVQGSVRFRSERRCRASQTLEQGRSAREAAVLCPGGGVFQRSVQTCSGAFARFGRGPLLCV